MTRPAPESPSDPKRFRAVMNAAGLDALIAWGGANFHFVTGFQNYFDNPGGSIALIPAESASEGAVIVASWVEDAARAASTISDIKTFPLWLEIADVQAMRAGTLKREPKPSPRFDLAANLRLLADAMTDRGLARGRIGIEMNVISAAAFAKLKEYMPDASFVDAAATFVELRVIKSAFEVDCIRRATVFAEEAMLALVSQPLRGLDTNGLKMIYDRACGERAALDPDAGFMGTRVTASIGGNVSPTIAGGPRISGEEPVFFDCGVSIHGYGSDTGRTLVFKPPTGEMRRIMDALCAGMEAATALFRPGTRMCDIFHAGQNAVRSAGLDWYTRGHIGHTMGLGMGEQGPYLSPLEQRPLEPGMVIALETPLYMRGLGGFQVEECFVVTQTGHDRLTTLPRDFLKAVL